MRLIDANEFKKRIDHYPAEIRDIAKKELRYVPTIEAEPVRHGKWLLNERYGIYCSECGSAGFEITGTQYSRLKTNYCWQCGEKMDEDLISCENCGKVIKGYGRMSASEVLSIAQKKYGGCYCADCMTKSAK